MTTYILNSLYERVSKCLANVGVWYESALCSFEFYLLQFRMSENILHEYAWLGTEVASIFNSQYDACSILNPLEEAARISTLSCSSTVQSSEENSPVACHHPLSNLLDLKDKLSTYFDCNFNASSEEFSPTTDWKLIVTLLAPQSQFLVSNTPLSGKQDSIAITALRYMMGTIEVSKIAFGNSNHVFMVSYPSSGKKCVLLRVYGNCNGVIDRKRDVLSMQTVSQSGLSPAILFTFNWGRIEEFVLNSSPSTTALQTASEGLMKNIFRLVYTMHHLPYTELLPQSMNVFHFQEVNTSDLSPEDYCNQCIAAATKLIGNSTHTNAYYTSFLDVKLLESFCPSSFERSSLRYIRLLNTVVSSAFTESFYRFFMNEILWMHNLFQKLEVPLNFSHNDLNPANFLLVPGDDGVLSNSRNIMFVDFEYSDVNYRCCDIGNALCELDYSYDSSCEYGYTKPLYNPGDDSSPMAYPRLPIVIWDKWEGKLDSNHPHYLLGTICLSTIKSFFFGEDSKELTLNHLRDVFVGMLSSHLNWSLWSFVMGTSSTHSGSAFATGSGGLDYLNYGQCRLHEYIHLKEWVSKTFNLSV